MKILIADSGATKTDWALVQDGKPVYVRTGGMHPAWLDPESEVRNLRESFRDFNPDRIHFYGAGCSDEVTSQPLSDLLQELFGSTPCELYDDLTAVVHAFLGQEEGVAAILGTGAASGHFKKGERISLAASLGFALGDEGSGADIGKSILKHYFRDGFSTEAAATVEIALGGMDYHDVMQKIYQSPSPGSWLGSLTAKVLSGGMGEEVSELVNFRLNRFAEVFLKQYHLPHGAPVVISGGVASSLRQPLTDVLKAGGFNNMRIERSPITELVRKISRT
ncbi:MAG: hypothetical protein WDZ29_01905 [Balneolaceae bacterium]